MRTIDYKPEAKGFEGSVRIDMPSYPQRLKYLKDCNFEMQKTDTGYEVSLSGQTLDALIKMLETAKKHVKNVNITHKKSKTTYASFDDMLDDSVCDSLCQEIAAVIINGVRVGGS